jgi:hypothetical protein
LGHFGTLSPPLDVASVPCQEVVETRQHHESLIIAKAKYDRFIDQNGGEVNA